MIHLPSFNCQFNVLYTADCPSLAGCSQAKHFSQRPISIHDKGATSAKLQTNKTLNKLELSNKQTFSPAQSTLILSTCAIWLNSSTFEKGCGRCNQTRSHDLPDMMRKEPAIKSQSIQSVTHQLGKARRIARS